METLKKYSNLILIGIIILLLGLYKCESDRKSNIKDKLTENERFIKALQDSLTIKKLENGNTEASKTVLQVDLKTLEDSYHLLSENQKKLYEELKENKKTMAIMREQLIYEISNIKNDKPQIINDSTLCFKSDSTKDKDFNYEMYVNNVKPTKNSSLLIKKVEIPDSISVRFEYDKKTKLATKVYVTHSNKYIKTTDMDGYVVPKDKETTWDKIKKTSGKIINIAIGFGAGFLAGKL